MTPTRLLPLLGVLALGGCTFVGSSTEHVQKTVAESIRYVKDARTNLCFAIVESNNGHFGGIVSIANVPCEAVAREVKP